MRTATPADVVLRYRLGEPRVRRSATNSLRERRSPYPPKRDRSAITLSTYCSVSGSRPIFRTEARPW